MAKTKGVYKRGKVWWLCYQDQFGIMHFESSNSHSKKEAEDLLVCRRNEVLEGKVPEVKRIKNHSFGELAESYLTWAKPQKAYHDKANRVKQLTEVFGNYPLRAFTTRLIEEYQSKRLEYNKPATVNRMLAVLKHMFVKAVDWNMVEEDVLKRIKKVKLLPENNKRLRFLSKEECQELISFCCQHLKPIVITALNTGMRRSEILNLKWSQVDLKHGFVLLEDTKNGEPRQIPINTTLRESFLSLTRHIDDSYVFRDQKTNKPYQSVKKSFATACKRAKIQSFRFHDMRHTFASQLVMAGVSLAVVKELLGHKTLTMTLRYSHLAPGQKVNAVNLLDNNLTIGEENGKVESRKCL
ncbi:MAG: tyrosine-type recombinase/integrase [Candidatus Anammoxibacter sp.]